MSAQLLREDRDRQIVEWHSAGLSYRQIATKLEAHVARLELEIHPRAGISYRSVARTIESWRARTRDATLEVVTRSQTERATALEADAQRLRRTWLELEDAANATAVAIVAAIRDDAPAPEDAEFDVVAAAGRIIEELSGRKAEGYTPTAATVQAMILPVEKIVPIANALRRAEAELSKMLGHYEPEEVDLWPALEAWALENGGDIARMREVAEELRASVERGANVVPIRGSQ